MALVHTILNREWLDQNANRAYPLADNATESDTSGGFRLPRSLIVDAIFPINVEMNLEPEGFHVSNVSIFAHGVTISFSHTGGSGTTLIGTVNVSAAGHTTNASYYMRGQGDFDGMIGKVTIGPLDEVLLYGGSFTFDVDGGRMLSTVFRPDIRGVKSIQITEGSSTSDKMFGAIVLKPGRNIRISVQENLDSSYSIRFDALVSEDLNEECGCENEVELAPPIRTLNGIAPKSDGSFELIPRTCVEIAAGESEASLAISDSCSEPCCGTPELEVIRNDLDALNRDVRGIQHFQELLESSMLELSTIKRAIQTTGVLGHDDSTNV